MLSHSVAGAGPDVVLLHGVGLDHTMWDRLLPALLEDHRVTTVDLRGHGASGPAAPGTSLGDLADDVLEVIDTVGAERVHLVGFSLGALVAAHLAGHHPDRVATLSLVSSVAQRTPDEQQAVRLRLEAAQADLDRTVDAAVERWFDDAWRQRDPDLVADVRRTMLGNDPTSYLACYTVFAVGDQEVGPLLADITAPTLAITGSDDPGSTPDMSHRLAAAIPDAHAVVVEGARHLLPLERPGELAAALTKHFERTTP
jgi:(E)-2-((N-methylformamido)methylene)succinate hydrolase